MVRPRPLVIPAYAGIHPLARYQENEMLCVGVLATWELWGCGVLVLAIDSRLRGNDEGGRGMVRWGSRDFSWSAYAELGFISKRLPCQSNSQGPKC